ncbi:MAG: putative replication protein [Hainan sediment alphaflexivirus 1]|nr:MAG: putative replication protein [Hainan sediment alphaflexivirus 1]
MALLGQALERFTDVSIKSVIQEEQLQTFRKTLKNATLVNPYAVPSGAAATLEKYGILTNPFAAKLHTHAAAKSIENALLQVVGKSLPQRPVTFYFLKRSKLNLMGRNPRIKDIFNNMTVEPRDFARYEPDTLRDHLTAPTTSDVYISDTLHFLPMHFLVSLFKFNPVVQTVYATLVLPPEAMHKHPSQHPDVYSINYDYEGFQYVPGSHGGGAYHHEFTQLDWLRVKTLTHKTAGSRQALTITAQMIESIGANHLFVFSRGKLLTPRVRTFSPDECIVLPQIFHPKNSNASAPISKTLAMQMYAYVRSLKSGASFVDVCAKLRQLIPTAQLHRYQPDEWTHICNYFYYAGHVDAICRDTKVLDHGWFTKGYHEIAGRIKELWGKLFGMQDFQKLMAVLDWQTFTYSIEPEDMIVSEPRKWLPGQTDPERDLTEDCWVPPSQEDLEEEATGEEAAPSSSAPPPSVQTPLSPDLPWAACAHILQACGFKGDQMQYLHGQLISPITDTQVLPDAEAPEAPRELMAALAALRRHPTLVTMNVTRGTAFASDVKNNRIGACTKNETTEWKRNFATRVELGERTIPTVVIHGAGGSGKSHAIQEFMRKQPHGYAEVGIILPTVELRADWMAKVPKASERIFRTYEKALIQSSPRTVVMDDYTKLPAGYIEAFCLFHPEVRTLILTGDPKQTSHHENNDQALIAHLSPACQEFGKYCRYYLNATHRNRRDLANMLGVYSELEGLTRISVSSLTMEGWPIIAPSIAKKTCLTELGHRAYSYAGCQGLTTPRVQVLLDNNTPLCSAEAMYTTLSRARDAIHFINTGPQAPEHWAKLDATPYLKTFLDLARDTVAQRVDAPQDAEPTPASEPTTHFPVENHDRLLEPLVSELCDKFDREMYDQRHGHTNAIQTEDTIVQLFQHQQAKDEALLFKTIEARIKISTPANNELEFVMKRDIGDILFLNYQRAMKLPAQPIPFSQELWDSSAGEVQNTYLSKPIGNIINGRDRQSPDFPTNAISLFLKSQWVKKTEKLGILNVKPGQTIASFMQQTVMLYGTMARYMRRIRRAYQPSNIFITCENTPEELDTWVRENWCFKGKAHSNDFTAFDQSQDGAMLQFEVIKAKFHGIPEEVIEGYVHLKKNAKIFLGTIAIMRLSGEGPTFDANTECAIAYHHTKYHVEPDSAQLYAGDDMAQDTTPTLKDSFALISDRIELRSKEVKHTQFPGDYATFCGWVITPQGIMKEPKKLYASLQLAKALKKTEEVRLNYAQDLKFAYSMGDRLHEVLTDEECGFHQATVRDLHLMGCSDILNAT